MPRYSETGLKLIKSSHSVEDSVVTNAPDIGPKLDEDFLARVELWRASQPQKADLDAPSFTGVLYILKDGLAVSRERLAEADMVHVENLRQFLAVRRVAKKHKTNVFDKLGATHRTIEELFAEDDEAFELTGIQIPTSQEPTKLLRQADQALKTLKSPDFVLPGSKLVSLKLDPEDLVLELESDVEVFREWDGKLRSSRREVQKSRKNKNRAVKEHGKLFLWTARTLEGYYQLAGEEELAKQIRPSGHRPGRRSVEVAEEEAAKQESAATPASGSAGSDSPPSGESEAGQPAADQSEADQQAAGEPAAEAPDSDAAAASTAASESYDSESPAAAS